MIPFHPPLPAPGEDVQELADLRMRNEAKKEKDVQELTVSRMRNEGKMKRMCKT
jgi:hypothetical protein